MNNLIELFGNHIYKTAPTNPLSARKKLCFAFSTAGLMCKYFPTKKLLPSRQFMQWAAADSAITPLKTGKNSAIVSLYLPCEILHSMGISTLFPEALACYLAAARSEQIFIDTAEQNFVSQTMCSYHKAFIGMVETGVLPKPDFIINTTLACDANHLSFRRAAEHYNVPQYMIDVPYNYSSGAVDYVAEQIKDMVTFIEKQGYTFDESKLIETVEKSKQTLKNFNDILTLRATRSLSDEMTSQMLSVFATHVMLGTDNALKYSKDLKTELAAVPEGKKGVRLLWVHTLPYWQDALRDLINFTDRCEIVACDMVMDAMYCNLEETDPYRFMADRLVRNTVNGKGTNRINATLELAKKLDADGIVWYCHWGCKQTAGLSNIAKSTFEANGFPTLILDGDGCNWNNVNDGQTVTRTEAFLELLENRK
ncbi:2-hydroxyacyl-CoA dehydratase family protein [uncultured Ruminococcus sp.]|uniref:2-hydroxyacyl-CoA dehydratase subunit D n=1 Tax=uncultured Ruminococcus sp. TaxID=165186 RepID=UPI0025D06E8B|nr:2-hydroxyacyl-CoA dehydratase family protein [uncultured Ruminococcus sp.]